MHTLNDISCIKTDIVEELKHEIRCKGFDNINPYELGQYVDMVKDLAKSEKDCVEKCYYETVIKAMNDHGYEDEFDIEAEGRMGYDNRRYASGRYAPKGRGHYSPVHSSAGYTPMHHPMQSHMPMMDRYDEYDHDFMGYTPSRSGSNSTHSSGSRMGYSMGPEGQYGQSYHDFDRSRKHYHETKDENERMVMEHHADKYINDVSDTVRDIWKDASPEMKKRIKSDMSKLVAEMAV